MRRWLRRVGLGALLLLLALLGAALALNRSRPRGRAGPEADALARRLERAVDVEAWARTGAVTWRLPGRYGHLWDRRRGFSEVRWQDGGVEVQVLLDVHGRRGLAFEDGREVAGEGARARLTTAHQRWINDAFWLNPLAKLFDEGTRRELVTLDDGGHGLLVTYSAGGLTPGDAYLWLPGEGDLPRAWRLWVSIIPVGGVEFSWEGWVQLPTGARLSTRHAGPLSFGLEDVRGAARLEDLTGGQDPFSPLLARLPTLRSL